MDDNTTVIYTWTDERQEWPKYFQFCKRNTDGRLTLTVRGDPKNYMIGDSTVFELSGRDFFDMVKALREHDLEAITTWMSDDDRDSGC